MTASVSYEWHGSAENIHYNLPTLSVKSVNCVLRTTEPLTVNQLIATRRCFPNKFNCTHVPKDMRFS